MKVSLVITSISDPNDILKQYSINCLEKGINFIVVGDVASPEPFQLDGCDYWSISRQKTLDSKLAMILPEKHYARKNLGYLIAIQQGAEVIVETDDDNIPYESFWGNKLALQSAKLVDKRGWVNVYRFFTENQIWPRGFPLEFVHEPLPSLQQFADVKVYCPIQQGLADANPDVDAIYRLLFSLPQSFSKKERIALGAGTCCPFNSQNTTWFSEAFPLLYLPSYCSFRMTDIWRSFVAQRICRENGWHLLFHESTVWQQRNEHNLMKDFADEIPGYLNNTKIWDTLNNLHLKPGNCSDNLRECYSSLISLGLVDKKEMSLLNAWLTDINVYSG